MFQDLLHVLLPSIEHFRVGGYWIAFFAALLETTIGIGLLLPGSTVILLLGAASARGYLDVGDLLWFAVLGAVIGDNINYALGRKYGARWLARGLWPFKADHVAKASRFMDAHGAKGVFFGRFIPSVKEVIPLIAGSLNMNRRSFMLWNVVGAVGWGCEWVLAGYVFAQSLNLAEIWLSRAGLLFAAVLITGGALYVCKWLLVRKGKKCLGIAASLGRSVKQALAANEHVVRWRQNHPRSMAFWQARFDPRAFSGLPLSISALAFVYVLALFGGIVEDLITSDPIVAVDIRMADLFSHVRTGGLVRIFTWITLLGKSQVILVFLAVSVALLWMWKQRHFILPLLVAVVGSVLFNALGKLVFHRPRPAMAVYLEPSFSFPSGHATIAVAFYGFVAYVLIRLAQSWRAKVNILFLMVLWCFAIGLSRVYLGEHYVSDVWSGYLVGALWLIIGMTFSEWLRRRQENAPVVAVGVGVRVISFLLLVGAALFYALFAAYGHLPTASVPTPPPVYVSRAVAIFSSEQLKYTETLIGARQEPINCVFVAQDDVRLIAALQQGGWTLTDEAGLATFFRAVMAWMARTPHFNAPLAPSFWNATMQDMGFAKGDGASGPAHALHLRLWRTSRLLKNDYRIYVGMVNAGAGLKWGLMPRLAPDLDAQRERLFRSLDRSGVIGGHLKKQLVPPQIGKNFVGDPFFTDGKVYLMILSPDRLGPAALF